MYHFPIVLGENESERIIMIHLTDTEITENRVVITPGNAQKPLFRIPKSVNFIYHNGTTILNGKGVNFSELHKIAETIKKRPTFDAEAARERLKGKNLFNVETTGLAIGIREERDYYAYYVKNDNKGRFEGDIDFTLSINYRKEDAVDFKGKVHIIRPSGTDEVMKINVDLGSDATQVNYFSDMSGTPIESVNLIEAMKNSYSSREYDKLDQNVDQSMVEPLFTQQERHRSDFYKTGNITFHEYKEGSKGRIDRGIDDAETFINYLNVSSAGKNRNAGKSTNTWDKEVAFKKKLINIKMLYAHMPIVGPFVQDVSYTDGTCSYPMNRYANLLKVLRLIYHQIISVSTNSVKNCRYYSVLLLVPNIYIQQNIDYLLSELNKELNDLEKPDADRFDFRVISESDAAFAGVKMAPIDGEHGTILGQIINGETDPKQKDMFLIIDAGKGTTDYSIIHYDTSSGASNILSSIKKGGIVGAGGAIDYVFARVFARQVFHNLNKIGIRSEDISTNVSEAEFIDRFMTLIQLLPPVDQDKMMLIVETLKKSYGNNQAANVYQCFESAEAKKIIINLLAEKMDSKQNDNKEEQDNQYKTILGLVDSWTEVSKWRWNETAFEMTDETDKEEIDKVCKAIAQAVIKDVFKGTKETVTNQIDYIVFTGRSFLFAPLKNAFEEQIKPYRDVFPVNFEAPLFVVKLMNRFGKNKKDLNNLKIANVQEFDMKTISVRFDKHNLGVNCNSDLCCFTMLSVLSDNGQSTFKNKCFWEGFTTLDVRDRRQRQKTYYIGYPTMAFAPPLNQQMQYRRVPVGSKLALIHMTMFPVQYLGVNFNVLGDPNEPIAPSTPNTPNTPNTNNGTLPPVDLDPDNGAASTNNNPVADHPQPAAPNGKNDRLDENSLN